MKLINNSKDYLRCVSKPSFISQKIFHKNFIAVHQITSVLTLNKPIYVGFSILELSKLLIYKFHYDYVCNKYDTELLFTDTEIMKLLVKMFMNSVLKIKNCLILVDIQKIQSIMIVQIKKFSVK